MAVNGVVFPVLFTDGEMESEICGIEIHPGLDYKSFLSMVSQKIGISPNQISIFLVDRNSNPNSMFSDDRRRVPITGTISFRVLCGLTDRCFLVVWRRPQRPRNRPQKMMNGAASAYFPTENMYSRPPLPDNRILRRRNQPELVDLNGRLQVDDLESRLRRAVVQTRMENYHLAMAANGCKANSGPGNVSDPNLDLESFPTIGSCYRVNSRSLTNQKNVPEKKKVFCAECWKAKKTGVTTPFHPCVYDPVVTEFRTRFGPISRPTKSISMRSA